MNSLIRRPGLLAASPVASLAASLVVALAAASVAPASAQGLDPTRNRTPGSGRNPSLGRPAPLPKPDEPAAVEPAKAAPVENQKTLDQIAAVVNGEVITRLELDDRIAIATKVLQRQGTQLPPPAIVERQVLERMIVEKAQMQFAVENGVRVDELQLDRAVQRVAESNNMSVQAFRDRVEKDGTPFPSFRDELRQQIMIERARGREVDEKVQVGEGEVDAFIAQQTGVSSDASPEVDVAQILLRVSEQATPDQVEKQRAKADDLYKQATGGADFSKLAVTYSEAPEALQGGDLGFRSQERLPQLFIDAITPLNVGQVAAPIRSPNGFHILKLVAKRGAGATVPAGKAPAPVQQTHARHILIKVNEVVSADQAKARLEDIRQRILGKTASFEDMARAYSNDASAAKGGDLGTLYAGDTVPEFEKAMNALTPGDISQPVQTQFGYHLIEVLERKTEDVAQDRLRLQARQALRERKIDEASDSWARELRDRAYVEMRLDDK